MIDYRIIRDTTVPGLEARVRALIKEGWEPQGAPFIVNTDVVYIAQAVVLDRREDK